ncbi:MAG: amino acid ABC transporter permease [Gammaproteobacteria bacterium]
MDFDPSYMWSAMPRLLDGAVITLQLVVAALVLSVFLATALTVARSSEIRPLVMAVNVYISFVRGTPLLVQLFLVFYVLPSIGLDLSPIMAGIITLGFNSAAYSAEIMRGGLAAIPKGQLEAARSLGLGPVVIWGRVILPQMFHLITPPLVNEFTLVIKTSPLVSVITVVEIMRTAQQIYNANYRPIEVLVGAAVVYFVIIYTISRLGVRLERRNALKLA